MFYNKKLANPFTITLKNATDCDLIKASLEKVKINGFKIVKLATGKTFNPIFSL
ncbi:MAG: hypothetical protein ACTSRZ_13740 [Promethearchaeota archaeon]